MPNPLHAFIKRSKNPTKLTVVMTDPELNLKERLGSFLPSGLIGKSKRAISCENFPHAGFVGFPFASFGPGWLYGQRSPGQTMGWKSLPSQRIAVSPLPRQTGAFFG